MTIYTRRGICYALALSSTSPRTFRMSNTSKPTQSSPLPGDDRNVVAAGSAGTELSIDEKLHGFWTRNRRFILLLVVLGFIAIVGREAVRYMWTARERGVTEAYAKCVTTDQLKAFAGEHPSHALAGFALLRVGDDAYKARNYVDAADAYQKAVASLKDTPMVARAKIGAAISEIQGGDRAKGEAALKALADDLTVMAGQRTEARFQLAMIALGDGRIEDARKALVEITQTDLTGMWQQRAMQVLSSLPAEEVASIPAMTPDALAPAASTGTPEIKLNIPSASDTKP
jgi:hypothetical protein